MFGKMSLSTLLGLVALLVALGGATARAEPLGPGFRFEGKLTNARGLSWGSGVCTLRFSLFDAQSGGSQLGATDTVQGVKVISFGFSVEINASGVFGPGICAGEKRWIQAGGNCGRGDFTEPARQPLPVVPFAQCSGSGGGKGWQLTGNDISSEPDAFLGTTSDSPLIIKTGANPVERMRIDKDGNVGIGVDTPAALVHAKGPLSVALDGTVTVAQNSAVVTGQRTKFATQLVAGDALRIGSEVFTVRAVASDTILELDSEHQAGATDVKAYRGPRTLLAIDNGDGNRFAVSGSGEAFLRKDQPGSSRVLSLLNGNQGSKSGNETELMLWGQTITGPGGTPYRLASVSGLVENGGASARFGALLFSTSAGYLPDGFERMEERMRITSDGAVGIGTGTDRPAALVHIRGGTPSYRLTGDVHVTKDSSVVTGLGTKFTTELKVGDAIKIVEHQASSASFTVSAIASDTELTLDSVHPTGTAWQWVQAYREPTLLAIDTGNGKNKVTVTRYGDVGIGTEKPRARLDVAGTISMTGFSMPIGAASGEVLTANSIGVGSWQPLPSAMRRNPDPPCWDNANRYVDCGNGTVHDTVTGLLWLKNADCFGLQTYSNANASAAGLAQGACGLSDGSAAGDWRLPTRAEWEETTARAVALSCVQPALSNLPGTGCYNNGPKQFDNVQAVSTYWSATAVSEFPGSAFVVDQTGGGITDRMKVDASHVWPIRAAR